MLGAIEAGGTKFICGVGSGPADLHAIRIPTTTPQETVAAAVGFLRERGVRAVGIGSFGPVDLAAGRIASTPKDGWRGFRLRDAVRDALSVPVAFDTDVNAAALGEARWGAARGVSDFLYITVGTGIGGGAMVNGALLHGLAHPEMGHMTVPHDRARDPFDGVCPYHGDCLEGLASGPAMAARWGRPAEEFDAAHQAWALEAHYLGLGLANLIYALSPKLIVMGGGVGMQVVERVGAEVTRTLGGYLGTPRIVAPELGSRAGVLGALALAETATIAE